MEAFAAGGMIVDNVVAADGTLHTGAMGGNAVYAAAGMRLWLDRVGIVATVPRDYPTHWLRELAEAGIDTRGIRVVGEDVTCSEWFLYRPDGSRADGLHAPSTFAASHGFGPGRLLPAEVRDLHALLRDAPPAGRTYDAFRRDHPVCPAHVPPAFRGAGGVHLGSNRADAVLELATALHRPGTRVTLDPGAQAAAVLPLLPHLLPRLDALLPSRAELTILTPGLSPSAALTALRAQGLPVAAAKLGADGAVLDDGTGLAHVPALPVTARDPTGAGDAWCGGFLAGWLRTGDTLAAACCGTVSASFAVQAFGPLSLLRADRVAALARLDRLVGRMETGPVPHHLHRLRSRTSA